MFPFTRLTTVLHEVVNTRDVSFRKKYTAKYWGTTLGCKRCLLTQLIIRRRSVQAMNLYSKRRHFGRCFSSSTRVWIRPFNTMFSCSNFRQVSNISSNIRTDSGECSVVAVKRCRLTMVLSSGGVSQCVRVVLGRMVTAHNVVFLGGNCGTSCLWACDSRHGVCCLLQVLL